MSNLYIYEQGSQVSYGKNRLEIQEVEGNVVSIPIENIDNLLLFGRIQVTAACMQELLTRGVPLTWLSTTGNYFGRLESTDHVDIARQRIQFKKSDIQNYRVKLAKAFISGKSTNQRTVLVRYNRYKNQAEMQQILDEMAANIKKIPKANSIQSIMGIEGYHTRLYYRGLNLILPPEFKFTKRTKRPPKDPFNAILSFGYTLLYYEIFTAVVSKGLNPYAAFLHSDHQKHAALCSDLMEEWRPILVDSLAVSMVNNQKIKAGDFEKQGEGVFLSKSACKKMVGEFEKRLRQEVSYISEVPYKMSFRRIIEYQIMGLIKDLMEEKNYKPVLIR